MSPLKKEVENIKEQVRAKLSGFATKSFMPFAMDLISFVEKVVDKLDEVDKRLLILEQRQSGNNE
jgi:hypothetical protein